MTNPYVFILVLTALLSAGVAVFVWQRRAAPGAIPILALLIGVSVWSMGYALELRSRFMELAIFWAQLEYLGIVTVPVSWFFFSLRYTGRERLIIPRNIFLLALEPAAVLLLVWSNPLHHLIWESISFVDAGGMWVLQVSYGPVFWVHTLYSYALILTGTVLVLRRVIHLPQIYRGQTALIMLATLAPWLSNLIWITKLTPIDPTAIAFAITALMLSIDLFGFQLLDIVPVAREAIIESMQDAVIVVDMHNRVMDVNPAAALILSMPAQRVIGKAVREAFSGYSVIDRYRDAIEAKAEVAINRNGQESWYDLRISPLYGRTNRLMKSENRLTGRVIVLRDITMRKRAEEMMAEARDQALQASLLKSQIIANVSHELRTPLNSILGYAEMLRADFYGPLQEGQYEIVDRILQSTHQMQFFVNDLLDQSLIEKGKLALNLIPFPPSQLISEMLAIIGDSARMKGLSLNWSLSNELPTTIHGDPKRLQQVLVNMVHNAIKFTEKGRIDVHIYTPGKDLWAIDVIDTGCGITAEAQAYIFEPFRQAAGATQRKHSGAGLGLAIVKHLVTMMGGTITVKSEVGHGSTFTVTLPVTPPQEKHL